MRKLIFTLITLSLSSLAYPVQAKVISSYLSHYTMTQAPWERFLSPSLECIENNILHIVEDTTIEWDSTAKKVNKIVTKPNLYLSIERDGSTCQQAGYRTVGLENNPRELSSSEYKRQGTQSVYLNAQVEMFWKGTGEVGHGDLHVQANFQSHGSEKIKSNYRDRFCDGNVCMVVMTQYIEAPAVATLSIAGPVRTVYDQTFFENFTPGNFTISGEFVNIQRIHFASITFEGR